MFGFIGAMAGAKEMRIWMGLIFGVSLAAAMFGGLRPAMGEDTSQAGGTLVGTITDDKDKPVAELPLRLYLVEHASVDRAPKKEISLGVDPHRATPLSEKLIKTVKTDAQGKFRFS